MRTKPHQIQKEKARYIIIANHVFNDFAYDMGLPEFLKRLEKHIGTVKRQAEFCSREENWKKPFYDYDSIESIEGNLGYIADRFNCAGRLLWLAGVLDCEVIKSLREQIRAYKMIVRQQNKQM